MFSRLLEPRLVEIAAQFPVVAILGARQVGKTTLARNAFARHAYADLEDPSTASRFRDDPRGALDAVAAPGIVLDEAQAVPEVFAALRGVVDADRRRAGRFIVLGSAQPSLVRGIAESLAGRVGVLELDPLTAAEAATGDRPAGWRELWLRGGYPDALSGDHRDWWEFYLRMLLERDLPQYGLPANPVLARRLLTMLAHQQGGIFNASALGNALGVSYHTVQRLVEILEAVFIVRRLRPYFRNVGKRLVKAPRVYLRDSGLVHHLLGIGSEEGLSNHPVRGASWEGFVLEDVVRRERIAHPASQPSFWRTAAGAEVDLVLDRADERVAIEIKTGRPNGAAVRALREAMLDIEAGRGWIIDQGGGIEALSTGVARAGFTAITGGTP